VEGKCLSLTFEYGRLLHHLRALLLFGVMESAVSLRFDARAWCCLDV